VPDGKNEILKPPRDVDTPAVIAEVALEVTGDGGDGVGGERAARRIVPVDRFDQPESRDLLQILLARLG
jgi:hypothetical protein